MGSGFPMVGKPQVQPFGITGIYRESGGRGGLRDLICFAARTLAETVLEMLPLVRRKRDRLVNAPSAEGALVAGARPWLSRVWSLS
jgi:hypothetical protein